MEAVICLTGEDREPQDAEGISERADLVTLPLVCVWVACLHGDSGIVVGDAAGSQWGIGRTRLSLSPLWTATPDAD